MTRTLRGVIHGRTIELETHTGLEDGRKVEVTLRPKPLPGPPPGWCPGSTVTAAGMMAARWTKEDDRILNEIHLERTKEARRDTADFQNIPHLRLDDWLTP